MEIKLILQKLILQIKKEIAVGNGFTLKVPTEWDYAMKITHRTKAQLQMYEMVFDGIIFHLPKILSNCAEFNNADNNQPQQLTDEE